MADSDKKTVSENQTPEQEKQEVLERESGKKEAEISVGVETREAIEGAEIPSGEISEKEQKTKEGYAGAAQKSGTSTKIQHKVQPLPPVKVMRKEVEKNLRKEMKDLQKKIRHVMEKGGQFEAYQLNGLIASLRRIQNMLASMVYATGEFIKELWLKYVKKTSD